MKVKVWEVKIGTNWTTVNVVARNVNEAVKKALLYAKPLPKGENFVRSVVLTTETDC